jgi:pimeloyl-ACP methyl ester carboxylesterase
VRLRVAVIELCALLALTPGAAGASSAAVPYCLSKGDGFRQLSFSAADGVRLQGITTGRGSLGLVLGHQFGSDSCEWYGMAKVFAAHGYRVLAIDFRGYGLSPVPRRASATAFAADIGGAATELRRLGARRVVAIGSSMGGTAVVVAGATRTYHLAGIVSISGAGWFEGNDALQASRRLTVPARFLAAREDGAFPDNARTMEKQAPAKDKALLILPGGTHGTSLLEPPGYQAARARAYVLAFLRRIAARA